MSYSDHRIRYRYLPVGKNVLSSIQELGCYLVEYLSFVWNAFRKYHIEGGNPVGNHHYKVFIFDVVHVTDFADIFADLSGKIETGLYDCCHNIEFFSCQSVLSGAVQVAAVPARRCKITKNPEKSCQEISGKVLYRQKSRQLLDFTRNCF